MFHSSRERPGYGRGVVQLQGDVPLEGRALVRTLVGRFRAPDYRPPVLPAAAVELLGLVRDADVAVPKIRAVVERDPMVLARVLQVANSAQFSRGVAVSSLHDALVRLGVNQLTSLFLEATVSLRIFRVARYEAQMVALRRHSAATARLARLLARRTALHAEQAFLAGLLHDVGIAAGLLVVADLPRGEQPPSLDLAWPAICETHEEAGQILCGLWKLPPEVGLAIASHHTGRASSHVHPLGALVGIAEGMAERLGHAVPKEPRTLDPAPLLEVVGLRDADVISVEREAAAALDGLS